METVGHWSNMLSWHIRVKFNLIPRNIITNRLNFPILTNTLPISGIKDASGPTQHLTRVINARDAVKRALTLDKRCISIWQAIFEVGDFIVAVEFDIGLFDN